MRTGRRSWYLARALALAAMVAQAAIPLLIAAEIAAASNATPICSAATAGDHKSGPQNPGHTCPICAAMAASAAVTATASPALPLPRVVATRRRKPNHSSEIFSRFRRSYPADANAIAECVMPRRSLVAALAGLAIIAVDGAGLSWRRMMRTILIALFLS